MFVVIKFPVEVVVPVVVPLPPVPVVPVPPVPVSAAGLARTTNWLDADPELLLDDELELEPPPDTGMIVVVVAVVEELPVPEDKLELVPELVVVAAEPKAVSLIIGMPPVGETDETPEELELVAGELL